MTFPFILILALLGKGCARSSDLQTSDDDFEVDQGYIDVQPEIDNLHGGIKRLWGVPDTKAVLGRVFIYSIPGDAFDRSVANVKFSSPLPSWLSFNPHRKSFEGVPVGASGYDIVTLQASAQDGSTVDDGFAITVQKPEDMHLYRDRCPGLDYITLASVVVDLPHSMSPGERVKLIQNMAALIGVKSSKISLVVASADSDPLLDNSAIMAGPGSMIHADRADAVDIYSHWLIQWAVGCRGKLDKHGNEQVKLVEELASNEKMSKMLTYNIVGWHVTKVNPTTLRVKRDLNDFSGDGDDDYEYDYNDYEYDYSDATLLNIADKIRKEQSSTDETVRPDVVTPVVTLSPHTERTFVPPLKPVVLSTPVYIPVKPTVVVEPTGHDHTPVMPNSNLDSSIRTIPTTTSYYTDAVYGGTDDFLPPTPPTPIEPTKTVPSSETTEYGTKNFPPRVADRIPKLAWELGNVYRYEIPESTFRDVEDGLTRNLSLVLKDENGRPFGRDSWIQFDPMLQQIYALPLEDHISLFTFPLEAMDQERMSTIDYVKVRVYQPKQARNFHHTFTATLKLVKMVDTDFAYSLDWQVKAVEKIANLFNGNMSMINVRNISTNPIEISWTNVSLVDSKSTVCPTDQLKEIMQVLIDGTGTEPTRTAKRGFQPEFQLKKIEAVFYPPCDALNHHHGMHHHGGHRGTHREGAHHHPKGAGKDDMDLQENTAPIIRNRINSIKAKAGSLFRYQVPDDTCYDFEESDSRSLRLVLLTNDRSPPPKDSWLQFDEANQEFFGLPLKSDIGTKSYVLDCIDRGHLSVQNALFAHVVSQSGDDDVSSPIPPVKFSLTFEEDFDKFNSNAYDKAELVDLIAAAFEEYKTDNVVIEHLESGSIKVEWTNSSLPIDPCPQEEILRLRQMMTDDNGNLKKSFKESFTPSFTVVDGSVTPSGSCLAGDTPTHAEEPFVEGAAGASNVSEPSEDYLLTFIVPAVIIAVMLIFAAIVACCLYRRRRYGKMSMTDDRTFVSKGIPIIFAEELDDQRNESAKTPTVLRDEKPPLPPPEYQRGKDGRSVTPPSHRGSREMRDIGGEQPYQPPPPFTASNGGSRNARPSMPPAYRKPPTYCPP